ncbi:MAG: tRNA nucleotidyltransferase, partial [Eudoraea sp.]|nr:tRNA nucleotidyltransferase [Eudoraea sp.]
MTLINYKKSLEDPIFKTIAGSATELSIDSFVIGGYVRDLLLERGKSKDIDIVAVGSGIELAKKVAVKLEGKPKV